MISSCHHVHCNTQVLTVSGERRYSSHSSNFFSCNFALYNLMYLPILSKMWFFAHSEVDFSRRHNIRDTSWPTYGWNFSGRTEHEFGVIFFVFLSTFFGNLEVCDVKTCNIFWKYMSATWSTCLCLDHYFIGGLFNCPYILPFLKKLFCFKTIFKAFCCQFLDFSVIL